jgi:hypothetical protein
MSSIKTSENFHLLVEAVSQRLRCSSEFAVSTWNMLASLRKCANKDLGNKITITPLEPSEAEEVSEAVVENTKRVLAELLEHLGAPLSQQKGHFGYFAKRFSDQTKADLVFRAIHAIGEPEVMSSLKDKLNIFLQQDLGLLECVDFDDVSNSLSRCLGRSSSMLNVQDISKLIVKMHAVTLGDAVETPAEQSQRRLLWGGVRQLALEEDRVVSSSDALLQTLY